MFGKLFDVLFLPFQTFLSGVLVFGVIVCHPAFFASDFFPPAIFFFFLV